MGLGTQEPENLSLTLELSGELSGGDVDLGILQDLHFLGF